MQISTLLFKTPHPRILLRQPHKQLQHGRETRRPEPRNPIPARHRSEPLGATAPITTNRNIIQDQRIRVRRWIKEAALLCVESPSINHVHKRGESRAGGRGAERE